MKTLKWLVVLLLTSVAYAQISGAGQLGCNAAPVTGTGWTTSTSVNATQILATNVNGAQVLVTLDQGSTLTVGAISFLGDPGDGNFVTLAAWQVSDPTASPFATISLPYTLVASTNKQFLISMYGMYRLQLKLTTAITGTATVTPYTTVNCFDVPNLTFGAPNFNSATTPLFVEPSDGTNAMGAQANFGTSPGAVKSLNVNASIMSGTTALGTPNTFGTTAPTGNALGVNASLFCGTALCGTTGAPANVQGALGHNGAAATTNRAGVLAGIVNTSPNAGTAATVGRDSAVNVGTDGTLWTSILPPLRPARYSASANFAASSTTDNACIYGNATNTVVLTRIETSGIQTTAGLVNVQYIRRSAAETGGTSANMTAVRGDVTNYAAASTTPVSYTGTGPTSGAAVGTFYQSYTNFNASAATVSGDLALWSGTVDGPIILIGTSQGVCVNLGNAALTGGTMDVVFRWLEISNISE